MKRLFRALVAVCAMSMASGVSAGVIQTFSDETLFSEQVQLITTEDFESHTYTPSACGDGGVSTFVGSQFSAELIPNGSGIAYLCVDPTPASQPTPQGALGLEIGATDSWVMNFDLTVPGVNAISMLLTDIAENNGDALLRLPGEADVAIAECCLPDGSSIFFGFITDSPVSSFSLVNTGTFDGWGLDNVQLATTSVPEPTTTALLALGLIGAGLGFRRRRISSSL